MIDLERRYEDSPELTALAREILDVYPGPELQAAKDHPWRIVFVNKPTSHYGGRCRKLDALMRFQTHIEFVIEIWHQEFEKIDMHGKLRLLCHELHHISETDEGAPRLRKHWDDYCEIPAHDHRSDRMAVTLQDKILNLRHFPQQTELAPLQKAL